MKYVTVISFCIAILFLFYLIYLWCTIFVLKKKNSAEKEKLRETGVLTGMLLSLAIAFYSIYNSNVSLQEAKKLAVIQTRPYITVEWVGFEISNDVNKTRGSFEKSCEYLIFLRNTGSIPAEDVSVALTLSYKNKEGNGLFKLSNNPDVKDAIPIPSNSGVFMVSPGKIFRVTKGDLFIHKDDADDITSGSRPVIVNLHIVYSALAYGKKWEYSIDGELKGKEFLIKSEKEIRKNL